MSKLVSCGVILLNASEELFLCHATGTPRWDLPKGVVDPGETVLQTAVRELWEETSLVLDPRALHELGPHDYMPAKQLHLFALRVAVDAFDIAGCRCHSTFPHRKTGRPTPEVDAFAWEPSSNVGEWCGKNLTRVLQGLDWNRIRSLPEVGHLDLRNP